MTSPQPLPTDLLRGLADAEVAVVSWDAGGLVLRVAKEVGPEAGLLRFGGVGLVNLAPRMTVEGIDCGGPELLPPGYLADCLGGDAGLGDGERVYRFRESWGAVFFVVAASAAYEVQDGPRASGGV